MKRHGTEPTEQENIAQQSNPADGDTSEVESRRSFTAKLTMTTVFAPLLLSAQSTSPLSPGTLEFLATATFTRGVAGSSTYSFVATMGYSRSREKLLILNYSGTGTHVTGVNVGTITFAKVGSWEAPITGDSFSSAGTLEWSDNFNSKVQLSMGYTGNLTSGDIVQNWTNTTTGTVQCGDIEPCSFLMADVAW